METFLSQVLPPLVFAIVGLYGLIALAIYGIANGKSISVALLWPYYFIFRKKK